MEDGKAVATPVHLWIIGLLGFLWNAGLAFDYLMINIRDPAYFERMEIGARMTQFIDTLPLWTIAAWGIGIAGGGAGSLLLLLRTRYSVLAFALSLSGWIVNALYQAAAGLPQGVLTVGSVAGTLAILLIAVLLLVYGIRMHRHGVLR